VHDDVDIGQTAGQHWIPNVDDPPGYAADVAAIAVNRHDPANQIGLGQPRGQGEAEPVSGTCDRHDR
jgi:hypothetical protein